MSPAPIYFAPLEGVTDAIFRRAHQALFPGVAKYFIPFISPTQHLTLTSREQRAVDPAENAGVYAVPQVLTKRAVHFVHMAGLLADLGYPEVNLNLGCPSGTVTAKGKGSGMLRDLPGLEAFLDEVFSQVKVPVSIKTRIGYESPEEWPALLEIFSRYPLLELIVHPRTREELYRGRPHRELLPTLEGLLFPWVYNGDLNTAAQCRELLEGHPGAAALMLGRGLAANPALAREAAGGERLTREELKRFHGLLLASYSEKWPPHAVLGHMREVAGYMLCCFEEPRRTRKALRKARSVEDYAQAMERLFAEGELRQEPEFYFPYE